MKLKMVADITDKKTNLYLKTVWSNLMTSSREGILNDMGHSTKWADMDYDNLTGEIKSKIVTKLVELG